MSANEEQRVAELLRSAVAAVDTARVDADLRTEAFKVAVALLTGDSSFQPDAPPVGAATNGHRPNDETSRTAGAGGADRPAEASDDPLDRIAAFLGCEREGLHRVFRIHNGAPQLALTSVALPRSHRRAATDIALLLMGARQGAGVDEFTAIDVLRAETVRYGKLDESNYSKALKPLDSLVQSQGNRGSLERKLTQPGIEAARDKVNEYVQASAT